MNKIQYITIEHEIVSVEKNFPRWLSIKRAEKKEEKKTEADSLL